MYNAEQQVIEPSQVHVLSSITDSLEIIYSQPMVEGPPGIKTKLKILAQDWRYASL